MPNITIPYELASNICAILGQLPAGQVAKMLVALDAELVKADAKNAASTPAHSAKGKRAAAPANDAPEA